MTKADNHTVLYSERVDAVLLELLNNREYLSPTRNRDLVKKISSLFQCSSYAANCCIRDAKKIIRRIGREKRNKSFINAVRDREYIVRYALAEKDYKLALQAMESRDKLLGLFANESKNSDFSLKDFDIAKLTDDQLSAIKTKIKSNENIEEYLKLLGLL